MKKIVIFVILFLFISFLPSAYSMKIASLANPNIIPIFVMLEKGYLTGEFVPVTGDVSALIGVLRASKADAIAVNYEAAQRIAKDTGFLYAGSTISRAIHIITVEPIKDKNDLESKKIVASFRGGSPDILFKKLNLKNEPTYTDLQIAVQLFLKGDFNAILLPEPHISNVVLKLKGMNKAFYVYDVLSLYDKSYRYPINAYLSKDETTNKALKEALKKSVQFINSNPDETVKIFNANFKKYFNIDFPYAALEEALKSGRLKFEYDE
ncbi:MAG: hypothetical protein N3C60_05125 [Calditerrivibrio sp.]|nr:hypothetical protein [Calditerrivibrio sp.]